jgi:hypothetical protein
MGRGWFKGTAKNKKNENAELAYILSLSEP